MMLHVAHAAQHGHRQILVRTVDTDVVVLAVMVSATLLTAAHFEAHLGSESLVPCTNWL